MSQKESLHTGIWSEQALADDPFVAEKCLCYGYDVYGDVIHKADWSDYVLLLFSGDKVTPEKKQLFNQLAIAIANLGPRDQSIQAAMCGGVGASTAAACLIAALSVNAGYSDGGKEILLLTHLHQHYDDDAAAWLAFYGQSFPLPETDLADTWPNIEHPPGFTLRQTVDSVIVHHCLQTMSQINGTPRLNWLKDNSTSLEAACKGRMTLNSVVAAAFCDLGFCPEKSELLYLLLRLPGAAVHSLEQRQRGWDSFPFHGDGLKYQQPQEEK